MTKKIGLDPYREFFGVDFSPTRLNENILAFRTISIEIKKLRSLDLTDVHPAIIFEPTAVYRTRTKK